MVEPINIPSMLLMIGYLTTPISSTGVSLSEFWAWVRYLAAVTPDPALRLTRSFADLDAHQKTILSDDFGMGVPMLWLSQRLQFDRIVDGRYFVQRIAASVGASQRRTAKRGPNKSPDFVARDVHGVWHVVECKGTQSGIAYSDGQIADGKVQAHAITFPRNHTGQRLVTGLSIGVEDGAASSLTIIDPELEDPFKIGSRQLGEADDAATRGVMSKVLRLTGFETVAEATASPLGRGPAARRFPDGRRENRRRRDVEERNERARKELEEADLRTAVFGRGFRGRELIFDLPRPIYLNDEPVMRVIVRQGIDEDVLVQLRERPTLEEPSFDTDASWRGRLGRNVVVGDERSATMTIGSLFRSQLILE